MMSRVDTLLSSDDDEPSYSTMTLLDRMRRVEGLDLDTAIVNLGGRLTLLERALRVFVATYRDGVPALACFDAVEPIAAWRRACHSLRGACSTLGAGVLPRGIDDFERRLTDAADVATLAPAALRLDTDLRALVAHIAAALDA